MLHYRQLYRPWHHFILVEEAEVVANNMLELSIHEITPNPSQKLLFSCEDGLKWHSCLENGEWLDVPDFAVWVCCCHPLFAQGPVLPTGHASWVVPLVLLRVTRLRPVHLRGDLTLAKPRRHSARLE